MYDRCCFIVYAFLLQLYCGQRRCREGNTKKIPKMQMKLVFFSPLLSSTFSSSSSSASVLRIKDIRYTSLKRQQQLEKDLKKYYYPILAPTREDSLSPSCRHFLVYLECAPLFDVKINRSKKIK